MTTLRQRFRDYWHADDYPETPEWYDPPRFIPEIGAAIVLSTGFVLTAPVGLGLLAVAPLIGKKVALVLGLVLLPLSQRTAKYVGGPVADHMLGIPREEA